MHVGLLGELEVVDDEGHHVVVAGAKLRSLLAVLAIHVGHVVPAEQLVDALWGEDPPAAVRNGLQGLVSKLRRTLGSPDLVAMRVGGYALDLPPEAVDVEQFERLVASGRAAAADGDLRASAGLLAEAELLWRGDALADFLYQAFAGSTIARLTELRLAAVEERVDAQLRTGSHQGATAELEELVSAHPLRERLRGQLMVALYRGGRQADALRTFQDGRRLLADELGLEPGHELRRLEAAILAQDPSLDAPRGADVPPHAASGVRSSIPASLTPLVGRDVELHDLAGVLAEHRLVTLVGPGGVGKTRLALEVARAASAGLELGACLVELAPVGDPAGVRPAIASELDLPDAGRLAEVIGDRALLIVLDNCEHVIVTAAEVAEDLLRRCPRLRILATSREALRVGGEVIWAVPPLAAADAVRLFVERAEAAAAAVDRSEVGLAQIADVCTRLDGLPLAIELAAARTRAFPIQQLATRLNDRFRLLTGGSRTALPRQQTLRAVVDWSYELLFDDEQRAFERLSVFPGGCDLATAEAVCADGSLPADDLGDLIHALVEKSLVQAVPTGAAVRFTQLQTLAQYGREKLAGRGDATRLRSAMAGHYARLCSQSAVAFTGDQQRAWLTTVDQDQDNLRAALEWADAAFACGGEVTDGTRALALTGRGLIEFLSGAPERADADLAEALALFRAEDDRAGVALAHSFYAELAAVRGDHDEARRRRLDVLAHYADDPAGPFAVAARSYSLAKLATLDDDLAAAEEHYRAAARGFGRLDRPVMLAMTLGMVADFDERSGDHAAAATVLEEAIATSDALGLRAFTDSLVARLGWVLLHVGEVDRAEALYERAVERARRLRNTPVLFLGLAGMTVVHRLAGRDAAAAAAASEALELFMAGGPRRFKNRIDPTHDLLTGAAVCCSVLAGLASEAGDGARSAALLGHAARLRSDAGEPVPRSVLDDVDRTRLRAIGLIGDEAFRIATEQGGHHELEAVLAGA
jgi:predicted ATPase/DNA-binding SARP family transcriptional activator